MDPKPSKYAHLMATIGGSLAAWSGVESGMGLLFNAVSGISDFTKAGAIFDAVVAFEARIAVLDAAMQYDADLTVEEKELWANLSARLRKLYKKRHEVAHFSVVPPPNETVVNASSIQPFFTWNKHLRNDVRSLTREQIAERSAKFSEASNAVSWFVNLMQRRKFGAGHQPPPLQEQPLIAHIRELIAQKKSGQTPPAES